MGKKMGPRPPSEPWSWAMLLALVYLFICVPAFWGYVIYTIVTHQ